MSTIYSNATGTGFTIGDYTYYLTSRTDYFDVPAGQTVGYELGDELNTEQTITTNVTQAGKITISTTVTYHATIGTAITINTTDNVVLKYYPTYGNYKNYLLATNNNTSGEKRVSATVAFNYCNASTVTDKTKVSYSSIPATVTNGGKTYNVKRATNTFNACRSLETAPALSNGLLAVYQTFMSCSAMTTPPTIPQTVTDMCGAFLGCSALETAPTLNAGVTDVTNYLNGCTSVKGIVDVGGCNPTSYRNVFKNTTNELYVINGSAGASTWRTIASQYGNVHYEADDNPVPDITVATPLRVASSGSKASSNTGTYAYIRANAIIYNSYLPEGWHNSLGVETLTDDGTAISPTWTINNAWTLTADTEINSNKYYYTLVITTVANPDVSQIGDYYELSNGVYTKTNDTAIDVGKTYYTIVATQVSSPDIQDIGTYYEVYLNRYTLECWVNLGDFAKHTFTLSVADNITDATDTTTETHTSTTLTFVLSKAYKVIDFYHDPNTETEGVAIGKYAESADLFEVEMDTELNANVYIGLPDYQTADTTDKAIYDNIVALGWDTDVLIS